MFCFLLLSFLVCFKFLCVVISSKFKHSLLEEVCNTQEATNIQGSGSLESFKIGKGSSLMLYMRSNSCKVGHAGRTYPPLAIPTPRLLWPSTGAELQQGEGGHPAFVHLLSFPIHVSDCTPKPPQTAPPLGTKCSNVCAHIQTSIDC